MTNQQGFQLISILAFSGFAGIFTFFFLKPKVDEGVSPTMWLGFLIFLSGFILGNASGDLNWLGYILITLAGVVTLVELSHQTKEE